MKTLAAIMACLLLIACEEGAFPSLGNDNTRVETPDENADNDASSGYVFDDGDTAPTAPASDDSDAAQKPDVDPPEPLAPLDDAEKSEDPAIATPPKPDKPDQNAAARLACTKQKGRLTKTPAGFFVCVTDTGQGQKSCAKASDCKGVCLARSRTCSPFKPLIGCNEIITSGGGRATVCID